MKEIGNGFGRLELSEDLTDGGSLIFLEGLLTGAVLFDLLNHQMESPADFGIFIKSSLQMRESGKSKLSQMFHRSVSISPFGRGEVGKTLIDTVDQPLRFTGEGCAKGFNRCRSSCLNLFFDLDSLQEVERSELFDQAFDLFRRGRRLDETQRQWQETLDDEAIHASIPP
jgi:hypothetical protein